MNRKIFVLLITVVALSSCEGFRGQRWFKPDAAAYTEVETPDVRACQYQAYKADRWKDNDLVDRCMIEKGYTVKTEGHPAYWWDNTLKQFQQYDREKASSN